MVKIKLCDAGGYVIGNGDLPAGFNPDAFLKKHLSRMIRDGIQELDIADELKAEMTQESIEDMEQEIDGAEVFEFDNKDVTAEELDGMLDNVTAQIVAQETVPLVERPETDVDMCVDCERMDCTGCEYNVQE